MSFRKRSSLDLILASVILLSGCERADSRRAVDDYQTSSGGSLKIGGQQNGSVMRKQGNLALRTLVPVSISGVVGVDCSMAKFLKVTLLRKVEGEKESDAGSFVAEDLKCANGEADFSGFLKVGGISPASKCRLVVEVFDGNDWRQIDELTDVQILQ